MNREICIHHLKHACIACDLAQEISISIILSTPPHALAYTSVDYFREIFRITQSKYPGVQAKYILDCSGYPGMAMNALRQRVKHIRYLDDQKFTQQLLSMAQQQEIMLVTNPAASVFDLLDQKNNREALYSWLTSVKEQDL
ncbi:MAG: hypothetical protein ABFQ95_04780 [Pseudomonadota bacterium]